MRINFLKFNSKPDSSSSQMMNRGFTLVETLIAIAILVLAIVGPLTIASNSLNAAYYAKDQVTAFYLAQEGIEYVRFLRDSNTLSGTTPWNSGFVANNAPVCDQDHPCGLDTLNIFATGQNALAPCSVNTCPVYFDVSTGLYRQTTSAQSGGLKATNFTRSIYIEVISPNEDKITVTVSWRTGSLKSPNNFQITEYVSNWQQVAS